MVDKAKIKKCNRIYYLKYRERILNKSRNTPLTDKIKEWRTSYYKTEHYRLRNIIFVAYGGICDCCGEYRYEFLAIDHKHKDGAHERKNLKLTGIKFYKHIISQGFPDKYRILCHNCNMALGHYGYCPHEKEKMFL